MLACTPLVVRALIVTWLAGTAGGVGAQARPFDRPLLILDSRLRTDVIPHPETVDHAPPPGETRDGAADGLYDEDSLDDVDAGQLMPPAVCPYAPFGAAGRCVRGYGLTRQGHWHTGYDVAGVPAGTLIRSASDGRVIFSGFVWSTGWTAVIVDAAGYGHVYAHMGARRINNNPRRRPGAMVRSGVLVRAGDPIGPVGNTGRIRTRDRGPHAGVHLHYALVRNDARLIAAIESAAALGLHHLGVPLTVKTTQAGWTATVAATVASAVANRGSFCDTENALDPWMQWAHASVDSGMVLWRLGRQIGAGKILPAGGPSYHLRPVTKSCQG